VVSYLLAQFSKKPHLRNFVRAKKTAPNLCKQKRNRTCLHKCVQEKYLPWHDEFEQVFDIVQFNSPAVGGVKLLARGESFGHLTGFEPPIIAIGGASSFCSTVLVPTKNSNLNTCTDRNIQHAQVGSATRRN
jgi:hypothetical protein